MTWTDEQFDSYVDSSFEYLEKCQNDLGSKYGIGETNAWRLNQETGTLVFEKENETLLCNAYALGTYGQGVWMWAWANNSILPALSEKSMKMQKLAEVTGIPIFENKSFEATDEMPWEICGMALKQIGGIGVYKCPSKSSDLFVVITEVTSNKNM